MSAEKPLCIVPARGVSPGVPKKNLKRINQKPLVAFTIESAVESGCFDNVYVSTESDDIAKIAENYGAIVPFKRPTGLSGTKVGLRDVVDHALGEISSAERSIDEDTPVVVLQPNVPFRRVSDIQRALKRQSQLNKDVIISVTKEKRFFWRKKDDSLNPLFANRDTLRRNLEPMYRETGSITVTTPNRISAGVWTGDEPGYIVTDRLSSFEVNSIVDFWLAEHIANGPQIVFRVDGGGDIGLGKIYRGLTLGREMINLLNCKITFVCDATYTGGIRHLSDAGFDIVEIQTDTDALDAIRELNPDLVFIDIAGPTDHYLQQLHQMSAAVVNLESFEPESAYADYVVNPQRQSGSSTPDNHLFGTDYLVVREEFHEQSVEIVEEAKKVLITFGGSDPTNLTGDVVKILGKRNLHFSYKLVLGPDFGHEDELYALSDELLAPFEIVRNTSEMGELMSWADMALSSGGRTVYELAATGTPSIVIAQNTGEVERMEILRTQGIIEFLGHRDNVDLSAVPDILVSIANDKTRRKVMSERGQEVVDGKGVQRMLNLVHEILVG